MVTIVGTSPEFTKEITCRNCASLLEYTSSDEETALDCDYRGRDYHNYIKCPKCKHRVITHEGLLNIEDELVGREHKPYIDSDPRILSFDLPITFEFMYGGELHRGFYRMDTWGTFAEVNWSVYKGESVDITRSVGVQEVQQNPYMLILFGPT